MRIRVDKTRFEELRHRYALRFCCEDCAHFVDDHCAHFWPTEEHRSARYGGLGAEATEEIDVVFCKEFELI